MAVETDTTLGPIIVAMTYLPPSRTYWPFPDFYRLLSKNMPTYIIRDLNAGHKHLGNNNNTVDRSLIQLINQGLLLHLGPHLPTFISHGTATKQDTILSNKHHYLNSFSEPGNTTTSDHLPIVFKLSTRPLIVIQQPKICNLNTTNWNSFQQLKH